MRLENPLILGAGPAGCAAAITLARGGKSPVVLERTRATGDALCGGFLSWRSLDRLGRLGIGELGGHPISEVRVFHERRSARAPLPGRAIGVSRHRLDSRLQAAVIAAGADLQRGVVARRWDDKVLSTDAGDFVSPALFHASGKHDLRGLSRPKPQGDAPLGLRVRLAPHAQLTQMLDGAIELHLFEGGYAGLQLQEDGSANLCMALRKSLFVKAGGDAERLLRHLGDLHPHLGERLGYMASPVAADAIGSVPYGWRTPETVVGVFRLGDQAAVIPSLAGEGMGIALASGMAAAGAFLRDGPVAAVPYQRDIYRRTRRPLAVAGLLWKGAETRFGATAALPLLRHFPAFAQLAARMTRIGD